MFAEREIVFESLVTGKTIGVVGLVHDKEMCVVGTVKGIDRAPSGIYVRMLTIKTNRMVGVLMAWSGPR